VNGFLGVCGLLPDRRQQWRVATEPSFGWFEKQNIGIEEAAVGRTPVPNNPDTPPNPFTRQLIFLEAIGA